MTNVQVFPRVFDALAQREGQVVTLPTLATLTGFRPDQVQAAIANARRTNPNHRARIEVVKFGRSWIFKSDPNANGEDTVEEVMEAVNMGSTHVWKNVVSVLVDNPNTILTRDEIVKRLADNNLELTPTQVTNAMLTIMRKPKIGPSIEIIEAGRAWRYKSTKKAGDEVSKSIKASVLRYFHNHPGVTLFVDDIAEDLGFTRRQVQSSMYSLANDDASTVKKDFTIVQGGHAWLFVPNRASSNGHVPVPLVKVPAQAVTAVAPAPTPAPAKVHVPNIPPIASVTSEPVHVPSIPKHVPSTSTPQPTTASSGGRLFEEIDQLADGASLLREAESGAIYRATKLG